MAEEYLVLAVALRRPSLLDCAVAVATNSPASLNIGVAAPARIVVAEDAADAQAQGLLWALEELPPQFDWEEHTLRVERLALLRPAPAEGAP